MTPRAKNLVLGALVADTAAMGTHWIYDQAHIAKIAPDRPEFIGPDAANYEGVPAYFAHATRAPGQTSQYGEQTIVMLRALASQGGTYDAQTYATAFRSHFGYGGAWVGYIDHATRETLNNFQRAEDDALAAARAVPFEGDAKITTTMISKAMALIPRYTGAALRQKFEEAVRITHDDNGTVAYALQILDAITCTPKRFGAVDEQMPATAKLPGLIAALEQADDDAFLTAIDSAVRVTSDHPNAHDLGRVCARMMLAALRTDGLDTIVGIGCDTGSPLAQQLIAQAQTMLDQDNRTVTKHFGMACDLTQGVPSVVHNMLTAPSYAEAIRRNIYAGGDTCGRAIILGSVLGAVFGVGGYRGIPEDWISKMTLDADVLSMLR